jgi:hypothetical protein
MDKKELLKELIKLAKSNNDIGKFGDGYDKAINQAIQLVKNCAIPDVVNQRELLLAWEEHSYGSEWSMHEDQIVPSIDEYLSK